MQKGILPRRFTPKGRAASAALGHPGPPAARAAIACQKLPEVSRLMERVDAGGRPIPLPQL